MGRKPFSLCNKWAFNTGPESTWSKRQGNNLLGPYITWKRLLLIEDQNLELSKPCSTVDKITFLLNM